jgi:hypothetical protein
MLLGAALNVVIQPFLGRFAELIHLMDQSIEGVRIHIVPEEKGFLEAESLD